MLKNEKIFLRAIEPSDVEILYKWENNPSVWEVSNTYIPFSKNTLEQYAQSVHDIFSQKQLRLIICLNNTGSLVGCIDLFEYEPIHKRAGLGIFIAEEYRHAGIASMALDLLMEYAFSILDLHQIYCNILSDNTVSIKLFTSKGFVACGHKKDWIKSNGKYKDEFMFQLIKNGKE
ncbi:MAG: GNAT family N-acetyltransferase [Flavobacteriales bacterium]|nr:GNAT family N-acetyltransferase [Flavobacteriales bacterium]